MLALLRPQDRLVACELEPNAAAALARHLGRDRRSKAIAIDGWTALSAYVPPKERRGLVLIDPPFEDDRTIFRGSRRGWRPRTANGRAAATCCGIRSRSARPPTRLARRLRRSGIAKIFRAEISIRRIDAGSNRLGACGLIVVNPPWTLASELDVLLPALATILAGKGGGHRVDWLAGES